MKNRLIIGLVSLCTCAAGDMPNVVLLSVDTLRANFLGCYGCPWDISPNIDKLAAESLVFDNACCETPLTAPSFSAMFTSQYPRMVGVIRNGVGIAEHGGNHGMFPQGWLFTCAVQSNWTLKGGFPDLIRVSTAMTIPLTTAVGVFSMGNAALKM